MIIQYMYVLDTNEATLFYIVYHFLSECQRLKAQVVQQIRSNKQLEQDLDVMDIKIGLLVKNRLTLQDLVSHSQQVRRKDRRANRHSQLLDGGAVPVAAVGGLTKANHEKVEVCWFVCVCGGWVGVSSR